LKIRKVLVSQPEPTTGKSPYFDLAEKTGVQIDFRPFIHVEPVSGKDFRCQKISIPDHSAIVFTSRTAIDHFFRIAQENRVNIIDDMKYYCISEAAAFYLQKYIVYRKRKIFNADGKFTGLIEIMSKHKDEKYLVPVSDVHKEEITDLLDKGNFNYTKAVMYRTVSSDLSDLSEVDYDVLVFFSPSGIASLLKNFPNFKQEEIKIASFGSSTAKAVEDAGLRLDIRVPNPQAQSMTMALDQFITDYNKKNK
jgi:uroporphyrinogen-III synthase